MATHMKDGSESTNELDRIENSNDNVYLSQFEVLSSSQLNNFAPERRRWPVVLFVVLTLLILLGVAGFAGRKLYAEAMDVKDDAKLVMEDVSEFRRAMTKGDAAALSTLTDDIAERASRMHSTTDSGLWRAASAFPVLGSDIRSVRTLAEVLDNLSSDAIEPLGSTLAGVSLDSLVRDDNSIDVAVVQQLADALSSSQASINEANEKVSSLPPAHLSQLAGPLEKAQTQLDSMNTLVNRVGAVAPYLPQMLGANGEPRAYLIVAQNNAEIRSTGGFPGAWGIIRVNDGHLELEDIVTIQGDRYEEELLPAITDEELAIFHDSFHLSPGNANYTPDFARAAELFSQFWTLSGGEPVAGVVAVDPVFLQNVLALTNRSVESYGVTIDGSNAAERLLNWSYWNLQGNDYQDEFFRIAANEAFNGLFSGLGGMSFKDLTKFVKKNANERRMQLWMANSSEEAAIEAMGLAGRLNDDPTEPVLGVYLNDNTWAKICWYLDARTSIGESVKNSDGTTTYSVTTTIHNSLSLDELYSAPRIITGYSPAKRDTSDMVTELLLVAPADGSISDVAVDGRGGLNQYSLYGHDAWMGTTNNLYGETTTFTYKVTVSAEAQETLTYEQTPLGRSFE